jgi:hypothetical protein
MKHTVITLAYTTYSTAARAAENCFCIGEKKENSCNIEDCDMMEKLDTGRRSKGISYAFGRRKLTAAARRQVI